MIQRLLACWLFGAVACTTVHNDYFLEADPMDELGAAGASSGSAGAAGATDAGASDADPATTNKLDSGSCADDELRCYGTCHDWNGTANVTPTGTSTCGPDAGWCEGLCVVPAP